MCIRYINTDVFPNVLLSSSRTLFSLTCRSFRMSLASVSNCRHTQTAQITSVTLQGHIISPGVQTNTILITPMLHWWYGSSEGYNMAHGDGARLACEKSHSPSERRGEMKKDRTGVPHCICAPFMSSQTHTCKVWQHRLRNPPVYCSTPPSERAE